MDQVKNFRLDLFLAGLLLYPLSLLKFLQKIYQFKPCVINVHFPASQNPFVLKAARYFNFKLVTSLHGNDIEGYFPKTGMANKKTKRNQPRGNFANLKSILNQSNIVTANSHYLLEKAQNIEPGIKEKGVVIGNGIDLERFKGIQPKTLGYPYIITFGRFVKSKGFDLIIEAFYNLKEKKNLKLLLVGDGPEKHYLESLVKEKGLEDRVHFYDKVGSGEILSLIKGSLFGVVPSREEGFGIAALEIMACGKLVVATNVGGLPEFVEAPHILVEPKVEDIKVGLESCIQKLDTEELDAEKIQKEFDWTNSLSKYEKVLTSSING